MKTKHFVIITVILAALVALYILQNSSGSRGTTTLEEKFGKTFPTFEPSVVRTVKAWPGESENAALVFEREGAAFRVPSKGGARASDRVERLLDDVRGLRGEAVSEKKELFPKFEVQDAAALHIVFLDVAGKELAHILAGKRSEDGGAYFRLSGGETTYANADVNFRERFDVRGGLPQTLEAKGWLDLAAYKLDADKVRKVELAGAYRNMAFELREVEDPAAVEVPKGPDEPGENKSAEKPKKKEWAMTRPLEKFALNQEGFKNWLRNFSSVAAEDVATGLTPDKFGFDGPLYTAVFEMEDNTTSTVKIGASDDGMNRYACFTGRDETFVINKTNVDKMFRRVNEFLDLKIFDVAEDKIDSITVIDPDKTLTYILKGTDAGKREWAAAGDATGFSLKTGKADQILEKVRSFTAFDILQQSDNALAESERRIVRVYTKDGNLHEISFGPLIPGRSDELEHAARVSGQSVVFSVKEDFFRQVFFRAGDVLELAPVSANESDVQSVEFSAVNASQLFVKKEGRWRARVGDVEFPVKEGELSRLINEVLAWRPFDFAAKRDSVPYYFEKPEASVALVLKDGRRVTLSMGGLVKEGGAERWWDAGSKTLAFISPSNLGGYVSKPPSAFILYRFLAPEVADITEIGIESSGLDWLVYQNRDNGGALYWSMRKDERDEKSRENVSSLMRELVALEAVELVTGNETAALMNAGFEKPEMKFTVRTEKESMVIKVGNAYDKKPGNVLVQNSSSRMLFVVPLPVIENIRNALKRIPTGVQVKDEIKKEKESAPKGGDSPKTPEQPSAPKDGTAPGSPPIDKGEKPSGN